MSQLTKAIAKTPAAPKQKQRSYQSSTEPSDRWNEGLANHEKLKRLLPFLNEEDGYL